MSSTVRDMTEETRKESPFINTVCLSCGQQCIVKRTEQPFCGPCYFRDNVLKPMLETLPNAHIHFLPHTYNFVVNVVSAGARRHAVIRAPRHSTHWQIDRLVAAAYESIRRLKYPDYKFDWRLHAELDDATLRYKDDPTQDFYLPELHA